MLQKPCRFAEFRIALLVFQSVAGGCEVSQWKAPPASVSDQQRSFMGCCYNIDFKRDNSVAIQRQIAWSIDIWIQARITVSNTEWCSGFTALQICNLGCWTCGQLAGRATQSLYDRFSLLTPKQWRPEGRQSHDYFMEDTNRPLMPKPEMVNYTGPINWAWTSCAATLLRTSCEENTSVSYLTNMRW